MSSFFVAPWRCNRYKEEVWRREVFDADTGGDGLLHPF